MIIGIDASHANKENRTGVEESCFQIIQSLKKTIPRGDQVILFSKSPLIGPLAKLPPNWKSKVLHWPFSKLWSQCRLSLHLLFHKPDIFFAPGQLVPFFAPKQTVAIIHDSAFMVYPEVYRFFGRQYLKWMNRRIIKKSAKIITSSTFNKRELDRLYGSKASEKTFVVPFAAKPLEESGPFEPRKMGLNKPYILYVGRLETKKSTGQLIEAFTVVKEKFNAQLVLCGKPGLGYKKIAEKIKQSLYQEDILNLGYVDEKKVSGLLKHATVFVFPSLYEGFGLPLLEAMSVGIPTVAADLESLREVGGEAAVYADPYDTKTFADQIIKLATNTAERKKLQATGPARAALFSWDKTAAGVYEVFEKMKQ